ncbi:hypothetical protein D3C76_1393290 [compost metagenome]
MFFEDSQEWEPERVMTGVIGKDVQLQRATGRFLKGVHINLMVNWGNNPTVYAAFLTAKLITRFDPTVADATSATMRPQLSFEGCGMSHSNVIQPPSGLASPRAIGP